MPPEEGGPLPQRVRPTGGDGAQGFSQRVIHEHVAWRQWRTIRQEEIGTCGRLAAQAITIGRNRGAQPGRDRKSSLGQPDGGCQQAIPRKLALGAVHRLQHTHSPRHAHRAATDPGFRHWHRLAVPSQEQVRPGCGRCGLAAVPGQHLAAGMVEAQRQRAAAEAGGLRLHQRQHHLHGHDGIGGRATLAQRGKPSFDGQGMGGCDDVFAIRFFRLGLGNGLG